jgi:hypothetical protein
MFSLAFAFVEPVPYVVRFDVCDRCRFLCAPCQAQAISDVTVGYARKT